MIPIDQTQFRMDDEAGQPMGRGNCLQAAVASLLELPLELVPHFVEVNDGEGDAWWNAFELFLGEHKGYTVVQVDVPLPAFGLMTGKSPRGNFNHVVVAWRDHIEHDPHPSRAGLDGDTLADGSPRVWWYLVPGDPASMFRRVRSL